MRTKTLILLLALAILHLIVILAGFVAPYDPSVQNRELPYAPPTRLHFAGASGFHLRPFVYSSTPTLDSYERWEEGPWSRWQRSGSPGCFRRKQASPLPSHALYADRRDPTLARKDTGY